MMLVNRALGTLPESTYYHHWFIVRGGLVIDENNPDGIDKKIWESQLRNSNRFLGKLLWSVDSLPINWGKKD